MYVCLKAKMESRGLCRAIKLGKLSDVERSMHATHMFVCLVGSLSLSGQALSFMLDASLDCCF